MDIESWVSRVDGRLRELVAEQSALVSQLGRDVTDFTDYANTMLAGGKRFRAVFCALGFATTSPTLPDSLCDLAVGLEIFHAAALAHDDIMDHSDTRRGAPSAHRRFEDRHVTNGWAGDGAVQEQIDATVKDGMITPRSSAKWLRAAQGSR